MRITGNRCLLALAGVLLLGGVVACAPNPATATKSQELDNSSQQQDFDDWQLAWEKCMQKQGIDLSQFMAKSDGSSGGGDSGDAPPSGSPSEADLEALEDAQKVCADELGDPPTRDGMRSGDELDEMSLLFAKCMRDAGYDFPDPELDSGGAAATAPLSDVDQADVKACSEQAGFPGAGG